MWRMEQHEIGYRWGQSRPFANRNSASEADQPRIRVNEEKVYKYSGDNRPEVLRGISGRYLARISSGQAVRDSHLHSVEFLGHVYPQMLYVSITNAYLSRSPWEIQACPEFVWSYVLLSLNWVTLAILVSLAHWWNVLLPECRFSIDCEVAIKNKADRCRSITAQEDAG